jgi:hypothetical protein
MDISVPFHLRKGKGRLSETSYFNSLRGSVQSQTMTSGSSAVTTARRVLRLRMEERPLDMDVSCECIE